MTSLAPDAQPDPAAGIRQARLRVMHCQMLLRIDEMLASKLGRRLSGSPYRTFLLELYLSEQAGRSTFQSCLSTSEPPANAHRRSAELAKLGAVLREPDSTDHRRINLSLALGVRLALDEVMDRVSPTMPASAAEATSPAKVISVLRSRLIAGGRIALPGHFRHALGLHNGGKVLLELHGSEVRIRSDDGVLRMVQEHLRSFAPLHGLASLALIAARRSEASDGR